MGCGWTARTFILQGVGKAQTAVAPVRRGAPWVARPVPAPGRGCPWRTVCLVLISAPVSGLPGLVPHLHGTCRKFLESPLLL